MNRLEHLKNLVKPYYPSTDPAHNWNHILRVSNLAHMLALKEKANVDITLAAALCHDLINVPKYDPRRSEASTLSAQEAGPMLLSVGFNDDEITSIKEAIITHSFSKNQRPESLEAMIVQDADRLDALGAIGVLRCASVSTHFGSDYFDPEDFWAKNRELNDQKFMVDHYQTKLFKLADLMNTKSAREMAFERIEFMKLFLATLQSESFPH
ncbi:MAG TPA: HD domain-containing protein [Bacteriovoracaceae bacterium]|nr:HD domain-containing protein [Bacteriovoracaceae bacterium]